MNPLEELAYDPARARDTWVHNHIAGAGVTQKRTWDAAIDWYKDSLLEWDDLPVEHAIHELRKGQESIFWPLFMDDQRIWADCPNHGRITVGVEGYCDGCGYPFDDAPHIKDWD